LNVRFIKIALLHLVICTISISYGFLDWVFYRQVFFGHPDICFMSLHGGLDAPLQYRIGVWILACAMHTWLHSSIWLSLTLIDAFSLWLSLWCLIGLLRVNPLYAHLQPNTRLLSGLGMFFLVEYYLIWGHWYQYPSTIPSLLFVCINLVILTHCTMQHRLWTSLALISISCIQGLIRADVAVILHTGFFMGACLPWTKKIPVSRIWLGTTSALAALVAGCVQLYLMLVRFPAAKYGAEGVFQVVANLHPMQWMTALLALAPFWLLLWLLAKRIYRPDSVTAMLLIASLLYMLVWYMAGQLEEVRIFLPFAIVLLPATALALSEMLVNPPNDSSIIR